MTVRYVAGRMGATRLWRRIERLRRHTSLVVLEYHAWPDQGYAIRVLEPHALPVRLRPGEAAARVLADVPDDARTVMMHVDASRTNGFIAQAPALWDALRHRGIRVLNARATDIRKSTLHARCEALGVPSARTPRDGAPDERVIIKTNLNSAGAPERLLARQANGLGRQFAQELNAGMRDASDYRICRRDEVPATVWTDPTLVVERFISNPDGLYFRVHTVGRATCVAEIWNTFDIKKGTTGVVRRFNHFYWRTAAGDEAVGPSHETAGRVAALVRRVHDGMGIDYGATDCVMDDTTGELVVVDANKTPGAGSMAKRPDIVEHLRRGFDDLLARPTTCSNPSASRIVAAKEQIERVVDPFPPGEFAQGEIGNEGEEDHQRPRRDLLPPEMRQDPQRLPRGVTVDQSFDGLLDHGNEEDEDAVDRRQAHRSDD